MERREEDEPDKSTTPGEPSLEEEVAKVQAEFQQPVSQSEIERRRKLVARTLKLREAIGPIGTSVEQLVREVREGTDEAND